MSDVLGGRARRRRARESLQMRIVGSVERHRSGRLGCLRAAVLGADDGIVSTASPLVGISSASGSRSTLVTTGIASLVAGAMSMAAGEWVSVSSQRDGERVDLDLERDELTADPNAELAELTATYTGRGVPEALLRQSRRSNVDQRRRRYPSSRPCLTDDGALGAPSASSRPAT